MAGIDAYTKLMLHCNGVDGSTTFTDDEIAPTKTVTPVAQAQIDTAQSQFGGASCLLDGAGDYLSIPDSDDFYFASGDFTIDFWMRINSLPSSGARKGLFNQYTSNNARHMLYLYNNAGTYQLRWREKDVTGISIDRDVSVTTGVWYHVAVVRYGNIFRIFLDGTQLGADTTDSDAFVDIAAAFLIGIESETGAGFNGWIDEFRVSKGIARWTGNFTPPTEEYSNPTQTKTILSDVKFKSVNNQETLLSDVQFTGITNKTINSDIRFIALDEEKTITSDVKFVDVVQETILSDVKFLATEQKTILSNVKFAIGVLYDINNKINTVLQSLYDTNNKFNMVKRVLSDINNFVNTVKSIIYDINNDIRTKGIGLYNATNDIRFLNSFQVAADNSFQSLGKGYIKVYINAVEQTDVDINSINITKGLNSAHTASFTLGRAYDSTKPTIESTIEITYHIWTLFNGYITAISPSDSPESMRIECQNEHWKQNQNNVHFQVGQKPIQSDDLFYDTIKSALSTEYSWNINAGNFVPETINCNNIGYSDALNNLISDMGNYAWFYDVDNSKKLWIAGEGNIINIQRQVLGNNLKLYDLISHQFSEDISELVNKYRVQMGEKVINQTRTVAQYHNYRQILTPAWDATYEVLAKDSIDGEGVDSHSPENASLFAEVFKKYNMPFLDSSLSSWSDVNPPYLEIYSINSQAFGFVGELGLDYVMTLTEGFTIDYDKKTITLTEPLFLYQTDGNGEITAIRAPIIKAFLWQKNYYTYSSTVTNPLEFETPKMGDYPTTIQKDLELSGLTIQDSQRYIYYKGIQYYVAPYDDTQYALDIANWNLSKICDKRITGTIEITLDALCFYNIDLTNRIYINGITDTPMNIQSISYDMNNFTVRIQLQNNRAYTRTVSLPYRGEE